MPRGDGAGPVGMGPMTGRAAGYCAGYPIAAGYPVAAPYAAPYADVPYAPTKEQQTDMLKGQAEYLESQLDDIRKRITELETEKKEKK